MELLKASTARRALKWRSTIIRPRNWVCQSCLHSRSRFESSRRTFATETAPPKKPFYVTTPIFYVNASPHVGHMYSMVLADVLKRWQKLAGRESLLCTGTDEHGMKVQQAAALAEVPPMQWCDENATKFQELADTTQIAYDRFIRTTDADHVEAVKHFWFLLEHHGYIYESKHEGWYCVSDECFYPESMIARRQDEFTGEVFMASVETGNKVEWIEEKNYHFRMTALKDKLLKFYEENPGWIVPASGMTQVVDWVKNNLEDLSISRPNKRLSWGIPVPEDPSQTIYVWVDALINYLTFAGFPTGTAGELEAGGWPADVHVIGKDILRFHCVYWPALLLALDLPLPKRVLSHAHWTLDHRKMSKSKGNAVNPFLAIERFGLDAMRFYMIKDGGIADDADYHNEIIVDRYKKHLQGGLGNLLARVTRAKQWSFRDAVIAGRTYHHSSENGYDYVSVRCVAHCEKLETLAAEVAEQMDKLNPGAALSRITQAISDANKFIAEVAPWNYMKDTKSPPERLAGLRLIYMVGETLRLSGILLQPFMPDKATMLLDILGVAPEKRTLRHAVLYCDGDYGKTSLARGRYDDLSLFPPLVVED
ncbi:putative methionine--tRNA ligase [Rhypophila decipiens]|uniref:Probable methionine--tRNA ligase, mitochondrial n=1 Tax=Rhypophila decipiens TaxID=261697 RepID=A0AAN6YGA4_9PEZI|nr:putative methionine--tRNA ligase [Rhypophila decipiens]